MKNRFFANLTAAALAALILTGPALAQNGPQGDRGFFGGPPTPEQKLARLSAALDLDPEQARQMFDVLLDNEAKRQALREQAMLMMGPEICALRAQTDEAILSILDQEQAQQFLQHREQRQSQAIQKRERRRAGDLDCSQYGDG
jgi:Spy/CpxP family protein refolding chaperone